MTTTARRLTYHVQPGQYAMCRVTDPMETLASSPGQGMAWWVKDDDGWSAVVPLAQVPKGTTYDGPWRALTLDGPFPFTDVGVLSAILEPLARADVPILAVSGFHTDHVLVPETRFEAAIQALQAAGHERADAVK